MAGFWVEFIDRTKRRQSYPMSKKTGCCSAAQA
jgi:hypothetical protein